MKLIIGNKNYSSWSLRPWLLLDAFSISFKEQLVSLASEDLSGELRKYSGSAKVPVLIHGDLVIWDSLAICEYVSEKFLHGLAWPSEQEDRALARAITAEMHAGFPAVRSEMPMNCRASRVIDPSPAALAEVARIDQIWSQYARRNANGDLRLFGEFCIADCFYAPVVMRFLTYDIPLSAKAAAYRDSIRALPSLQKWCAAAKLETEVVEVDEAGQERT